MSSSNTIDSNEALVSIIIPVFNTGEKMRKTLDSVLNQTWSNLEIILVDDASTDETTLQIMQNYAQQDQRFRIIRNTQNKGLSFSRNIGEESCHGEFLSFVDSDDLLEPEFVRLTVDAIQKNHTDFALCSNTLGPVELEISKHKKGPPSIDVPCVNTDFILSKIDVLCFPNGVHGKMFCTLSYRNAKLKFEPKATYAEDFMWSLSCLIKLKTISLLSYVGYHYILHNTSHSHSPTFKKVLTSIDRFYHLYRFNNFYGNKVDYYMAMAEILSWINSVSSGIYTDQEASFILKYCLFTLNRCGFTFDLTISKSQAEKNLENYKNQLKLKALLDDPTDGYKLTTYAKVYALIVEVLNQYDLHELTALDEETYFKYYEDLYIPE